MKYILEKVSIPGWVKEFDDPQSRIDELRNHICSDCLVGDEYYIKNGIPVLEEDNSYIKPVDVTYDGKTYECRDLRTLLQTACGLEYEAYESP